MIKHFFSLSRKVCFLLLIAMITAVPAYAKSANVTPVYQSNGHKFSVSHPAKWITPINIELAPTEQTELAEYAVRYHLFDRQIRFTNKNAEYFYHLALQPTVQSAVESAAQIMIEYSPSFQTLNIHFVKLLRDGKEKSVFKPDQVRLIQRETDLDKNIYDGSVSALLVLEDVRVGDVIEYAYTLTGDNPVFGGIISQWFSMGWSYPLDRQYLKIVTPRERQIRTSTPKITKSALTTYDDVENVQIWDQSDVPAYEAETQAPPWFDPYPAVQVTEFKHWSDVSKWALSLYPEKPILGPLLEAQLEEWIKTIDDPAQRIVTALQFVQKEVRYFGIELGQNTHRPESPSTVLERRYGDCKDKTLMLVSLLRRMGLEAYPALVSTELHQGISNWLPAPNVFDHVITAVRFNNEYLWLDPTRPPQYGALNRLGVKNYGAALVLKPGGDVTTMNSELMAVPSVKAEEHYFISAYDKPADMLVITRFSGLEAERQRAHFNEVPLSQVQKEYLSFYSRRYEDISVSRRIVVDDDRDANELTVIEFYTVPKVWEIRDSEMNFTAYAETIQQYTALPKSTTRNAPLYVQHPIAVAKRVTIHFPEDLRMEMSDGEVALGDDVVELSRASSFENNTLVVDFKYLAKKDEVPVERVGQHIKLLKEINNNLYYNLVMNVPRSVAMSSAREKTERKVQRLIGQIENAQ